jgi:hypothetical protein
MNYELKIKNYEENIYFSDDYTGNVFGVMRTGEGLA